MELMFWIWLGVIVLSLVVEFVTMDLVSIWFTLGAIIPFILSATKAVSWEIQLIIFVVITAVLICTLRKVTKKWLFRHTSKENLNTLVGTHAKLLERVDEDSLGQVKIHDIIWSVKSENDTPIEKKGESVEIVKMSGNKLIVKKIENKEKNK